MIRYKKNVWKKKVKDKFDLNSNNKLSYMYT